MKPTVWNLKHLINGNFVKNCPVTINDINVAERIYGPNIGALKGKFVRQRPPVVQQDNIEIPEEILRLDEEIILYIDNIFINGLPFLSTHDERIKYAKTVPLKNRSSSELYEALDEVLRLYNGRGFTVREIHCDWEFKPLMDPVKDMMGVEMHYPPAGDHVPQAERLNRVIGERVRAIYHDLPLSLIHI